MKNFIRKLLGIEQDLLNTNTTMHSIYESVNRIDEHLDSREPCKICGHHRYHKNVMSHKSWRYEEIKRDRKRRKKAHL